MLLLFAVVLRGLIPLGMMPDLPDLAQGRLHLVICTEMGPAAPDIRPPVAADGRQHAPPADPGRHEHSLCPFAAALALFGPVLLPVLLALLGCAAAVQPLLAAPFIRRHAPCGWTARGPPALA